MAKFGGGLAALLLSVASAAADGSCVEDAMLVFDGSASMAELGTSLQDAPRIVDARQAMALAMPLVAPFRRVGLIVYGPNGTPGDGPGAHPSQSVGCRSIDLRFAPVPGAGPRILTEIEAVTPGGSTPLTGAVREAARVLSASGVVVLVTDGRETCGGAPCALAADLAQEAAVTVHVVGFKVRAEYFDWESGAGAAGQPVELPARCLADATGGRFVLTESVGELVDALYDTLGCPLIGQRRFAPNASG